MAIKKVTVKKPLKKAQFGNTGPGGTAAKSNIGPKIAAGVGSALTVAGLAINNLKKKIAAKEAAKEAAKPKNPEDMPSGEVVKQKKGGATKSTKMKKGGSTGDKKWIQKAINPAHKGYCTPMTKPTCTPKRKALAKTLKKMAKNR